jgi:chaperone modulatory protein CbpM
MITIDQLYIEFDNLLAEDLNRWIGDLLLRPQSVNGTLVFQEIDVARLRLIMTLRDEFEITEPAFPTILSLLDQLYELRRQLRRFNAALEETVPQDIRSALLQRLEL